MDIQPVSGSNIVVSFNDAVTLYLKWNDVQCWCTLVFLELQRELSEWGDTNKLLQRHGFKPVQFADPVENKNLSGKALFFHYPQ